MTCTLLRTRAATRQRRPLSVKMVEALETVLHHDAGRGEADAIIAGAALLGVYGRVRVGDLRQCAEEPVLDEAGDVGFIETHFIAHKTARPGSKRALPIAGSSLGVTSYRWARLWLDARKSAGLRGDQEGTLVPALGQAGEWLPVPFTTPEFAAAFRGVLFRCGFSTDDLINIGAHSLKTTALSWAAKFGLPKDLRRMLGYHVAAGDRSMETYARDAMAGPLRELNRVLLAIRVAKFHPDATRSGVFAEGGAATASNGAQGSAEEDDVASSGVDATVSSSTCSSSRSASSEDEEKDEQAPAAAVDAEVDATSLVLNERTKFVHIAMEDHKLVCGKPFPMKRSFVRGLTMDWRRCPKCF